MKASWVQEKDQNQVKPAWAQRVDPVKINYLKATDKLN